MILDHCSRESCVQIIEGLKTQVAALTKECDDLQDKCNNFQNKCRAAQAQNARLRGALREIVDCPSWAIGSLDMQRYREMTK